MAERSVKVRLVAVVDDFKRGTEEAAKSVGKVGDAAEDAGKKSERLGDAAKAVGKVALTGLAVATTTTVGLGTAALKAGLAYNSLEQTSRAALTTLLGSAAAATDQMDKLREFGRTSPFSRATWIEAQNQLLAFGFAAGDVIPTLQSINDAMSALGGNDQAIREVVRVLAQVQSTGQVTAGTLNQLGVRGINAAELIGQAFGKTAGEIRQEVSSGAIDAQTFLTTLVDQMSATYAGAADLVRVTWAGAVDRIKGAFRDIGSILAAPFIDPMGGGAAVEWGHALADAMRALEAILGPVVSELANRAGPTFDRITEMLLAAADALNNANIDQIIGQLDRFGPALAGLGAAGAAASTGLIPFIKTMSPQGALISGVVAFVASVPEARDLFHELLAALEPLVPIAIELARTAIPLLVDAVGMIAAAVTPVVGIVGAVGDSVAWWSDRLVELNSALQSSTPEINEWGANLDATNRTLVSTLSITGKVGESYSDYKDRTREAAEAHSFWEAPLENTRQKLWETLGIVESNTEATGFLSGKYTEVRDRALELIPTLGDNAEAWEAVHGETAEATEQLESYLDTVRRATDPVYALESAVRGVESAQRDSKRASEDLRQAEKDLAKLRKSGEASADDLAAAERRVEDAQIAVDESSWKMVRALDEAERAALAGELSFEEFEARLSDWVRQGAITADQADDVRDRVKDLRSEAEDYQGEYSATITQVGADATYRDIARVKQLIEDFKDRGITLTVHAQTGSFAVRGHGFAGQLAEGGPVNGPGTGTSDSVPAWLSRGEHVWTAREVSNAGGHEAVAALRDRFRFARGGGLGELAIKTKSRDPNLFATDFSDQFGRSIGRDAAKAGKTLASVVPGRVLPRGSYRIGMPYLGYPGHYGADYPAPPMTPVYAMAAGMVERAARMATSYGNHIFLRHANGIQTRYAHMLGLRASQGQSVGPGQHIGWVGSSGNSTGPHLHFEYRRNGAPVNPASLGIFDQGGLTKPGSFGGFDQYQPERVLTPRQNMAFERLVAAIEGGGSAGPLVIENHIEVGGEVVRVVRTEISEHDRGLARRVGAGTGRAR